MYRWIFGLATCLLLSPAQADLVLTSDDIEIHLDPETLAVDWIQGSDHLRASAGGPQRVVSDLEADSNQARWHWANTGVEVSVSLGQRALTLRFKARHPGDVEWFRLPEQETTHLLLPLGEGARIPLDHSNWTRHLVDGYAQLDTTEGLSLPLWTQQAKTSRDLYLSWVLHNPFDNELNFERRNGRIGFSASHRFTELNLDRPFEVRLTVDDSALSGALAYREWRRQQGQRQSLQAKRDHQPDIDRLIGASQVYLFGPGPLSEDDVTDWWGLKRWFLSTPALERSMNEDARRTLTELTRGEDWFSSYHRQLLVDQLNRALEQHRPSSGSVADADHLDQQFKAAQDRLNWLSQEAGAFLKPSHQWGAALSEPGIQALRDAGLKRLWLGLNSWTTALYQPNAVVKARRAGYLVAAYDSYNTAIPAGINDSWLSAQIPDSIRKTCAIIQEDGTPLPGFRNHGAYLNPACGRDYAENRMRLLVALTGLNSLFLDADAAGMVREDQRNGQPSDQADMARAFNDRLSWASNELGVVMGSEGGHAVTSRGIAFAQGPQSRVFGWLDDDLRHNRESPYYLGPWYPPHRPEVFFKPVALKPAFYDTLFNPRYRIPLYQTVFHDELVSGHHWHSDSLKFPEAQAHRDLTAMLYNVPPMVHLSRRDLSDVDSERLTALKHYQSGFLPMHQALWNRSLVEFEVLAADGLIQRTEFSDGSALLANFDCRPRALDGRDLPPYSVTARLPDNTLIWQSAALDRKDEQFGCQPPNS